MCTTNTEDTDMAPAAIRGSSKPAAAIGVAATSQPKAQTRFILIARRVLRETAIASGITRSFPRTGMMSAAGTVPPGGGTLRTTR